MPAVVDLVAIPWTLGHLPTLFLDSGYRGILNPLVLPGFVFGIFAGAIVLIPEFVIARGWRRSNQMRPGRSMVAVSTR